MSVPIIHQQIGQFQINDAVILKDFGLCTITKIDGQYIEVFFPDETKVLVNLYLLLSYDLIWKAPNRTKRHA
jgi:hypothetical protein